MEKDSKTTVAVERTTFTKLDRLAKANNVSKMEFLTPVSYTHLLQDRQQQGKIKPERCKVLCDYGKPFQPGAGKMGKTEKEQAEAMRRYVRCLLYTSRCV